jgi:hypothetical protein
VEYKKEGEKVHLNLGRTYYYYSQIWKNLLYSKIIDVEKKGKKILDVEKRKKNTSTTAIILDV